MKPLTTKYKNIEYLSKKSYRDFNNFSSTLKKEIDFLIEHPKGHVHIKQKTSEPTYSPMWAFVVAAIPLVAIIVLSQQ
ncbi:MAG: hypothetical protein OCC49_11515 [Fibrobacterales bacterium]